MMIIIIFIRPVGAAGSIGPRFPFVQVSLLLLVLTVCGGTMLEGVLNLMKKSPQKLGLLSLSLSLCSLYVRTGNDCYVEINNSSFSTQISKGTTGENFPAALHSHQTHPRAR